MLRVLLVAFVAVALQGAERWVAFRSGPFEVYSSAGERPGRERLNELEQLRFALEQALGRSEMRPVWPVRILVHSAAVETDGTPQFSRDAYYAAVTPAGPAPRTLLGGCAKLLIEAGPGRLPDEIESALASVFSTLDAGGRVVMLGAAPPPSERTREWAKMHMLAVSEAYYGKLRTLVYNLERGSEPEPAYRNATGKSAGEIDQEAEDYLRQGRFTAAQVKRKSIDPATEFDPEPVGALRAGILRADLLLSDPGRAAQAEAAYRDVLKTAPANTEALEGLGLASLFQNRTEEACAQLAQAVAAPSSNANAFLAYGRLESDRGKAKAALEQAAKLNPRWGQPYLELARNEPDAKAGAEWLAAAVKREPRRLDLWRSLAEMQEAAGEFVEAAKSWASAEVAAGTVDEKQNIRQIRAQADERRRDQEAAARDRKAAEARREVELLKQKSMASIRAAIDKANRENPPMAPSSGKIEPWWTGPRVDGKVQGTLRQVDCLGQQARLIIEGQDRQVTKLLIRDPSQVAFAGGGEKAFLCGVQRPVRRIVVEYYVKPDAGFGTAGDAAVIEFP